MGAPWLPPCLLGAALTAGGTQPVHAAPLSQPVRDFTASERGDLPRVFLPLELSRALPSTRLRLHSQPTDLSPFTRAIYTPASQLFLSFYYCFSHICCNKTSSCSSAFQFAHFHG